MSDCVVITGHLGGLGQQLVGSFTEAGYHVVGIDRHGDTAGSHPQIAFDLGGLATPGGEARLRPLLLDAIGGRPVSALINNAALQIVKPLLDLDAEALLGSFRVNVMAPLLLTRLLAPQLESAAGTVINIGSIHATLSKASFGAYAVSKSALAGLTRAMAIELGTRFRTIEVRPAAIATPMLEDGFSDRPDRRALLDQYHPSGAIATPEEIAAIVRSLVETKAAFANGAVLNLDGGISHVLHDPA